MGGEKEEVIQPNTTDQVLELLESNIYKREFVRIVEENQDTIKQIDPDKLINLLGRAYGKGFDKLLKASSGVIIQDKNVDILLNLLGRVSGEKFDKLFKVSKDIVVEKGGPDKLFDLLVEASDDKKFDKLLKASSGVIIQDKNAGRLFYLLYKAYGEEFDKLLEASHGLIVQDKNVGILLNLLDMVSGEKFDKLLKESIDVVVEKGDPDKLINLLDKAWGKEFDKLLEASHGVIVQDKNADKLLDLLGRVSGEYFDKLLEVSGDVISKHFDENPDKLFSLLDNCIRYFNAEDKVNKILEVSENTIKNEANKDTERIYNLLMRLKSSESSFNKLFDMVDGKNIIKEYGKKDINRLKNDLLNIVGQPDLFNKLFQVVKEIDQEEKIDNKHFAGILSNVTVNGQQEICDNICKYLGKERLNSCLSQCIEYLGPKSFITFIDLLNLANKNEVSIKQEVLNNKLIGNKYLCALDEPLIYVLIDNLNIDFKNNKNLLSQIYLDAHAREDNKLIKYFEEKNIKPDNVNTELRCITNNSGKRNLVAISGVDNNGALLHTNLKMNPGLQIGGFHSGIKDETDISESLRKYREQEKFNINDRLTIAISCHGEQDGTIRLNNQSFMSYEDLFEKINSGINQSKDGKKVNSIPKTIVIQSCFGESAVLDEKMLEKHLQPGDVICTIAAKENQGWKYTNHTFTTNLYDFFSKQDHTTSLDFLVTELIEMEHDKPLITYMDKNNKIQKIDLRDPKIIENPQKIQEYLKNFNELAGQFNQVGAQNAIARSPVLTEKAEHSQKLNLEMKKKMFDHKMQARETVRNYTLNVVEKMQQTLPSEKPKSKTTDDLIMKEISEKLSSNMKQQQQSTRGNFVKRKQKLQKQISLRD